MTRTVAVSHPSKTAKGWGQPHFWSCKRWAICDPSRRCTDQNGTVWRPVLAEPCKRQRDKSAPWKSLRLISTFAPLLLRRAF